MLDIKSDEFAGKVDELVQLTKGRKKHLAALMEQREALDKRIAEAGAPYDIKIHETESVLRQSVMAAGQSAKHGGVRITYTRASERVAYDWRQVDTLVAALATKDKKMAALLSEARKVTVVAPRVSVSVKI